MSDNNKLDIVTRHRDQIKRELDELNPLYRQLEQDNIALKVELELAKETILALTEVKG